jgi:hypothetical protein
MTDSIVPQRRRGATSRATSRRGTEQHPPAQTAWDGIRVRGTAAFVTVATAGTGVAIAVFGHPMQSVAAAAVVASLAALIGRSGEEP